MELELKICLWFWRRSEAFEYFAVCKIVVDRLVFARVSSGGAGTK